MSPKNITRRTFLAGSAASIALAGCGDSDESGSPSAGASGGSAIPKPKGKVVILGFDGCEPGIFREMMAQGELPNYAKLAQSGTFSNLGSTIPPQSPVAWTSFSTCKNPGGHNIFDFIRRNPRGPSGPMPAVGTGKIDHATFAADGSVEKQVKAVSYRKGDTFWTVADQQGLKCKVFNVPFAFPADEMDNGIQLCGLGVPDLRGTTSTFFSLSDAFTPSELESSLSGGKRIMLSFDGNGTTKVAIPGPRHTGYKFRDPKAYTTSTVELSVDRKSGQGSATVNGKKIELAQGVWSDWVEFEFPMTAKHAAYGIARFFPIEIGEHVRIYTT